MRMYARACTCSKFARNWSAIGADLHLHIRQGVPNSTWVWVGGNNGIYTLYVKAVSPPRQHDDVTNPLIANHYIIGNSLLRTYIYSCVQKYIACFRRYRSLPLIEAIAVLLLCGSCVYAHIYITSLVCTNQNWFTLYSCQEGRFSSYRINGNIQFAGVWFTCVCTQPYYLWHYWELCEYVDSHIAAREIEFLPIKQEKVYISAGVWFMCKYTHLYCSFHHCASMQVKLDSQWLLYTCREGRFPPVKRRYSWNVQFSCAVIRVCVMDYYHTLYVIKLCHCFMAIYILNYIVFVTVLLVYGLCVTLRHWGLCTSSESKSTHIV